MAELTALVDELLAAAPAQEVSRPPAARPASAAVPRVTQSTRRRAEHTVGRGPVLAAGRGLLAGDASSEHLALVGEAGLGKSRLLTDLQREASAAELPVGRGRGLPAGRGEPYRPLAEAVTALAREWEREHGSATGPRLDPLAEGGPLSPHRAALSRLVPGWSRDEGREPLSSFVVAEAVAALTTGLGRAAVISLDDLQWADPETLDVVEALVRRGGPSPYRLLLASRPAGAADDLLSALERDDAVSRWRLGPLAAGEVAELAEDVLGGRVPPALVEALVRRSDGVPLVVEELVNGLVLDEALVRGARGGFEVRDHRVALEQLAAGLPENLSASVWARLDDLDEAVVRIARGAALLGREFGAGDVGRLTGLGTESVRAGLATLLQRQVVERLSGSSSIDHRFVHSLTREAVLTQMDGPQLAREAAGVLDSGVLDTRHQSPAELEQAGELALLAGRDRQAVDLLRRAGRLSAQQGALASAERQLRRAVAVTAGGPDQDHGAEADLVEVLAVAGRHDAARQVGDLALAGASGGDLARLHLGLARAAEATDDLTGAETHAKAAEAAGAAPVGLALLRSRLALAGRRLTEGQDAALAALSGRPRPEQACEALELLARCARTRDEAEAEALLERMAALARAHGLAGWELRALSELGTVDLFRLGDGARLRAAREVATASGDLVTATQVGYHETIRRFHAVELDGWEEWVAAVESEATTYGLVPVADAMQVLRTCFTTLSGGGPAPTSTATAADHHLDADREAALWGIARTIEALVVDDLDRARASVARGVAAVADREFGDPSPMWGTHALLETAAGSGDEAVQDARRRGTVVNQVNAGLARWCDAVVLGRTSPEEATAAAGEAITLLAPAPFYAAVAMRVVRPLALEQGWAAGWEDDARASAEFLRDHGHDRPAQALGRTLSRPLGGRPGDRTGVPDDALTAREREVLRELREGLTNAEIGERLFISPRTVEKHVERLLAKTGASNRTQLATRAT